MSSAVLIGCTGLVGSHILKNLISSDAIAAVNTFSRRPLPEASEKVNSFVSHDTSQWIDGIMDVSPRPTILFSAFGTTRAAAGSFENQYKIDHALQLELARAANQAGCRVCVLISSSFANDSSSIPYARMKGRIEEDIKALQFEETIILRPGMILGARTEGRPAEDVAQSIVKGIGLISPSCKNMLGQEASVIAEAATKVGIQCLTDKPLDSREIPRVRFIERSDIVKHART
ncbi:hypothetical protein BO78DRAFT_432735 [Aspergillus sclerotiicarbonarius CBS 121057]|uniref:NAD(P)-binding domain-containing protein n=1 Tax=Aspergillus sclerotiicarbonarius (strain CBS 121057 / IBT 28362) TaxID=1448318 RepID=A0A319DXT9_ASPSB|nr:hypothetical protein BO78DRAFT_432735 [Aspergillus sclerotiicarbonarius CBS 121057]